MENPIQLSLLENYISTSSDLKISRSGTFVDNMKLPMHRWFRYSAGFSADWVEQLLRDWKMESDKILLDPFAGSGTVSLVCDKYGLKSYGVEAHPMVSRIFNAKLSWASPVEHFVDLAEEIISKAQSINDSTLDYPDLVKRSFSEDSLHQLDSLRVSWQEYNDGSPSSELVWLAITGILRSCSSAGTAQWQYILPNKTKKKVLLPYLAFSQQIKIMAADMHWMQSVNSFSHATLISGDARECIGSIQEKVDAVITSPPYANNYDYADALRFEMSFWGDVNGWGDLHDKVRKHLIVSSSQHSSKEGYILSDLLSSPELLPIRSELSEIVNNLAVVREDHGGKKHYHTMIAAYCRDIALVLRGLRQVCRPGVRMCWVIGDSAPYGIYCPIDKWIGELAISEGFLSYRFDKLRDRNTKWKNRKHRVPLKEGLLWIEG